MDAPPRACPACLCEHRSDWLDACLHCGLETFADRGANVRRRDPSHEAARVVSGVSVTHDAPPRAGGLYRDGAPRGRTCVRLSDGQGWTLLIPAVMFGGPFVSLGLLAVVCAAAALPPCIARGHIAEALAAVAAAMFGLAGLAIGLAVVYATLEHATRRTTLLFEGSTLRVELRRFALVRKVTVVDRARLEGVGLCAWQRDTTQVLLLTRDGGAICVALRRDAADAESLAAALARAVDGA